MVKRIGPKLRLVATCMGCEHEASKHYQVQGDSGHDVECKHPEAGNRGYIGDTTWNTPDWCPLLAGAKREFLEGVATASPSVESAVADERGRASSHVKEGSEGR